MIKKFTLWILFSGMFYSATFCQDFLGLSTGNYAGITGVMLQPASIADSRHKFDINLFSTGINYSNNYFLVHRDAILKFNKNNFDNYAQFKSRYLSERTLDAGEKVFFNINNRVQVPLSFMATTGKKSAIALNMQLRSMVQGRGISAGLAKIAYNNFYHPPLNNTSIDASGVDINALNWAEVGFTYGRVLYNSDKHFIKAAFTGKYLGGVASLNIGSNNLLLQVNADSSFNFQTSSFKYNHNKNADYDIVLDKNFRPDANAFGFDAGLVYEYRGNLDKVKYLAKNDERSYDVQRRDLNKYIFKLGVSLLDVGMFTFDKPANVNNFSANIQNWQLNNANYKTLSEFDTALAARVTPLANNPRSYSVYLPTAFSVQADIRFVKGLFLHFMSYNPVEIGNSAGKRFDQYGYFTITPRYERRRFGIYIPYTVAQRNDFSDYRKHSLGLTLRAGPLFVGSSNLGSMLFNENLRSADVHLGLKVGVTYGKPNKSSRIIEQVFAVDKSRNTASQNDILHVKRQKSKTDVMEKVMMESDSVAASGRVIMNYKNGNIYENGEAKGNIIIINNYYGRDNENAGSENLQRQAIDSVRMNQMMRQQWLMQEQAVADSVAHLNRIVKDTMQIKRMQIDTLIRSMQQLQKQIDSTNKASQAGQHGLPGAAASDSLLNILSDSVSRLPVGSSKETASKIKKQRNTSSRQERMFSRPAQTIADKNLEEQRKREIENLQQQQAILYRQYENQASELSKDISRLNDRLNRPGRNESRNRTEVIPINIGRNSGTNDRVVYLPAPQTSVARRYTDTIVVRDTIYLASKTDHVTDTVSKNISPGLVPVQKKTAPGFDYSTLPAEIVFFDVNKFSVLPIYNSSLKYIAGILKKDTGLLANVTGHTDPTGPLKVNEVLSRRRAQSVAALLKSFGAAESQIITNAVAANDPAVEGTTKADNRQNRRVEINITHK